MKKSSFKKNVLLFCQAPADVLYILDIYLDHLEKGDSVSIVVVNVRANYLFLKSLDLQAELFFIPHLTLKNPWNILVMKFRLHYFLRYFKNLDPFKIYFFSESQDYVTAFFVAALKKGVEVIFINHYRHYPVATRFSLLEEFMLGVLSYVFSVPLRFYQNQKKRFFFAQLGIDSLALPEIDLQRLNIFKFSPKLNGLRGKILFFETEKSEVGYFENYENEISEVLSTLSVNFDIYLKGHPRLGLSKEVAQRKDVQIIPSYVPGEFLNVEQFDYILGIDTTALIHLAHQKENVYCLLPIFTVQKEIKPQLQTYLEKKSEGRLVFLDKSDFDRIFKAQIS